MLIGLFFVLLVLEIISGSPLIIAFSYLIFVIFVYALFDAIYSFLIKES